MIYKSLKKFARNNNWYRTDDSVFGLYQDFCYNIFQSGLMNNPGYKMIHCKTGNLNEEQVTNLQKYLESNKTKFGYKVYEIGQDFIRVIFYENLRMTKIAKLESFLESFSKQLTVEKVNKVIRNELVSNSNFGYYNLSGEGVILTADEYKKIRSEIQRIDEKEDIERSSYFKGFIGAILFSIPVIILWLLFAIYLGMLSTGFGFILALAAYFGYENFKGRLGSPTKWILIIVTIISILLANLFTLYYQLSGYGVTITDFMSMLQTDEQVKSVFLKDFALGLIIGFVGWLWIIFGLKTKNRYIKQAKKVK